MFARQVRKRFISLCAVLLIAVLALHHAWRAVAFPFHFRPRDSSKASLILDNFPSAASRIPPVPEWNRQEILNSDGIPLLIGFTRNWRMLQQAVVSYIAGGWPSNDIYVVENTGVLGNDRNLDLQHPFFVNYTRLEQLGVNIVRTPTRLNFAQLQNFYIHYAMQKQWNSYYWSHMDVIVLSDETQEHSLYKMARLTHDEWQHEEDVAAVWFAYDRLALVNVTAFVLIGGWDTSIGYYFSDCDVYSRLRMHNLKIVDRRIGHIWDVGSSLRDLSSLYRYSGQKNDSGYRQLVKECASLEEQKNSDSRGRNHWQIEQGDHIRLEQALQFDMEHSRRMYRRKWGTKVCDISSIGLRPDQAWQQRGHLW